MADNPLVLNEKNKILELAEQHPRLLLAIVVILVMVIIYMFMSGAGWFSGTKKESMKKNNDEDSDDFDELIQSINDKQNKKTKSKSRD